MTNKKKFLNLLGIARQSGNIIIGEDNVLSAIKNQQIRFLVIAKDSGQSTSKKFHDKSKSHQIPFYDRFNREEISKAIGMSRTIIGINNDGFAKHLNKMVMNMD
ncbi:50S ribosomal protein L7ae [Philodulcilactobacillus myokoensis]|uniref:50S ribosomal protein L7ae n=1 Tax=Philodulcilactobacillus myokoensis TaxID=2929573 RepID=A0A9W6ET25_9LACO|nr:ribosomal L7Ae/L30e/S12e/Gadd45 family protein [Philodulcilactobacillus myokoensis]GLB46943.1 50S ribosomal protein L7ae [Philodulcilactobacillus myokoensis]